jgi:hypothetical protein
MQEVQQDGKTLREHLKKVSDQVTSSWFPEASVPKELQEAPTLPLVFSFCWHDFLQLHNARQAGFSINCLSYAEIKSYFELTGFDPEPWHVSIIKVFDSLFMQEYAKQEEKKKSKK